MNEDTKIDVIMAAYNAARFIDEAIESICCQTYKVWQLIIIDDCSTDETYSKLLKWKEKDPRIKILQTPSNLGVGGARDFGIAHANSRYIAMMDSDDVALPMRFEQQLEFMKSHPEVIGLGTQTVQIDEKGREIGQKMFPLDSRQLYELLYTAAPIQVPTLMLDRQKLPGDFQWFEGIKCAEDTLFFFKILQYGKLANMPEVLQQYRYYADSVSARRSKEMFFETWRSRRLGRIKYGYKATLRSRFMSGLQFLIVVCMPNSLIPVFYRRMRRIMLFLTGNRLVNYKK